jgi:carboxypeptidase T
MNLIVRVSSDTPRASLLQLLQLPLGLDVWEVKSDYVVLRASEPQVHRLHQMGYKVVQLHETETFLSAFATAESLAGYHSVQTLEQDLKILEASRPEIAELREIGRSVESRPI